MRFDSEIAARIASALGVPAERVLPLLASPPDPTLGDIAIPCFPFAKERKQAPPALAAELASRIAPDDVIESVRATGPYLNVTLRRERFVREVLADALSRCEKYGDSDAGAGQTIVLDYSSPNIAKTFGVGHLRSTNIGAAIKRILETQGFACVGVNHLGDWGTQFGKLIVAFRKWGSEEKLAAGPTEHLAKLYVEFHEKAKADPTLEDEARATFKKLESGDAEVRALWERFRTHSLAEFQRIYDILGVAFESSAGEAFYNDKMDAPIRALEAKGLTKMSEGALIVDLEPYGMPPCLLRKKDEASLYATRDLAAMFYRQETYKPAKILYVTGADQKLHFRQLFKVLELLGHELCGRCIHVDFGMVRFGGERMRMREGRVILLNDVLERGIELTREILGDRATKRAADTAAHPERGEGAGQRDPAEDEGIARAVGVGAVLFADLKTRRVKDVDFDWDRVLQFDRETMSFKGETGPYLQYMHARLCSIIAQPEAGDLPDAANLPELLTRLTDPQEIGLVKQIARFPDVLADAARTYEPSVVATYLIEVASAFSAYYYDREKHRVLSEDRDLSAARLALCKALRIVMARGLRLLGIMPLSRM